MNCVRGYHCSFQAMPVRPKAASSVAVDHPATSHMSHRNCFHKLIIWNNHSLSCHIHNPSPFLTSSQGVSIYWFSPAGSTPKSTPNPVSSVIALAFAIPAKQPQDQAAHHVSQVQEDFLNSFVFPSPKPLSLARPDRYPWPSHFLRCWWSTLFLGNSLWVRTLGLKKSCFFHIDFALLLYPFCSLASISFFDFTFAFFCFLPLILQLSSHVLQLSFCIFQSSSSWHSEWELEPRKPESFRIGFPPLSR